MIGLPHGEINYDNMLSRFHPIPACDGQTDGRTETELLRISISRVSSGLYPPKSRVKIGLIPPLPELEASSPPTSNSCHQKKTFRAKCSADVKMHYINKKYPKFFTGRRLSPPCIGRDRSMLTRDENASAGLPRLFNSQACSVQRCSV